MLSIRKTALAVAACSSALVVAGCGTSERSAGTNSPHPVGKTVLTPHGSLATSEAIASAVKLAGIQLGHEVSASDPLVKSIEQVTAMLLRRCREDTIHIDGIADSMSSDLRKHGISETPLAALKRLDRIVPPEARSFDCTGAAAGYLVLREPE
jgi:hypothetical protein